jgi:hypothetical protein
MSMSIVKKSLRYIVVFTVFILTYSSSYSQIWNIEPDTSVAVADSFYVKYGDSVHFDGVSYQVISVPVQSFITVDIYEYEGNKIATLVSDTLGRGAYRIEIANRMKNQPMGMYIMKVNAEVLAGERYFQDSFVKYVWFVLMR